VLPVGGLWQQQQLFSFEFACVVWFFFSSLVMD
jgi:hypothetical protein